MGKLYEWKGKQWELQDVSCKRCGTTVHFLRRTTDSGFGEVAAMPDFEPRSAISLTYNRDGDRRIGALCHPCVKSLGGKDGARDWLSKQR